jgi:hypothetical protein
VKKGELAVDDMCLRLAVRLDDNGGDGREWSWGVIRTRYIPSNPGIVVVRVLGLENSVDGGVAVEVTRPDLKSLAPRFPRYVLSCGSVLARAEKVFCTVAPELRWF